MMDKKVVLKGIVNTEIVGDKTVREVERIYSAIQKEIVHRGGVGAIKAGLSESIGIPQDVAIAAMIVWRKIGHFRYTEVGERLTIRQLNAVAEDTRSRFICQHVINYAAYYAIQAFYDWLVDKNLIARFSKTESFWRKLDAEFKAYQNGAIGDNEQSSKMMFLDYVTYSYGNIEKKIVMLEVAVRDYLIQHRAEMVATGQKDDIASLQKITVCMYLLSFMQNYYEDYFLNIVKTHGVDFSSDFRYADLSKMTRNFIYMCEAQGLKFSGGNEKKLLGVEVDKSARVNAAWKVIVCMLTDEELGDATASKAIAMNSQSNEDYPEIYAEEAARREQQKQQEMEEGFKMLEEKYRVIKQK